MDSNRLLRAAVTAVTLLLCLWGLRQLESWRKPYSQYSARSHPESAPAPIPAPKPAENPVHSADSLRPVAVLALPLAALDNTCFSGTPKDISCYTGMISGAPAQTYDIPVESGATLDISVEPQSPDYDASFALWKGSKCLLGRDDGDNGMAERVTLNNAEPGLYRLVVGGYWDDCGPYMLTVRTSPAALAEVRDAQLHRGPNGTVIRWQSFAEVDLSDYRLYRVNGSERERIAVLRAHGSAAGFSQYRFIDRNLAACSGYELESVARDGRSARVALM